MLDPVLQQYTVRSWVAIRASGQAQMYQNFDIGDWIKMNSAGDYIAYPEVEEAFARFVPNDKNSTFGPSKPATNQAT